MAKLAVVRPLLLLAVAAAFSEGFNLEPRIAIVKEGDRDSYFGFSVSQHQIIQSRPQPNGK